MDLVEVIRNEGDKIEEAISAHELFKQKRNYEELIRSIHREKITLLNYQKLMLLQLQNPQTQYTQWQSPTGNATIPDLPIPNPSPPEGETLSIPPVENMLLGEGEESEEEIRILHGLNVIVGENKIRVTAGAIQVNGNQIEIDEREFDRPHTYCKVVLTKSGDIIIASHSTGSTVTLTEVEPK